MTTWIKRILLALLIIFLAIFALCAYRMHSVTRAVPVLNYHQINDRDENSLTVHTDEFDEQMKYLSDNGYHAITPEEMMEIPGITVPNIRAVLCVQNKVLSEKNRNRAGSLLEKALREIKESEGQ